MQVTLSQCTKQCQELNLSMLTCLLDNHNMLILSRYSVYHVHHLSNARNATLPNCSNNQEVLLHFMMNERLKCQQTRNFTVIHSFTLWKSFHTRDLTMVAQQEVPKVNGTLQIGNMNSYKTLCCVAVHIV